MREDTIHIEDFYIILDKKTAWLAPYNRKRFKYGDCNGTYTLDCHDDMEMFEKWQALRVAIYTQTKN